MTASPRMKFYRWDRTGMAETQYPATTRYVRKEDWDVLWMRFDRCAKELTDAQLRVHLLEAENAELRRMVLEEDSENRPQ